MIGNHRVILIAAVDKNWAIGKRNKLPWRMPSDLRFFNSVTKSCYVVYGHNTLQSLPHGQPFQNRHNIILTTKDLHIDLTNAYVSHSVEEVVAMLESNHDGKDVYIAGGQSIYNQFIQYCDYAYITKIGIEVTDADAHLMNLDEMPNCEQIRIPLSIIEDGVDVVFHTYKIHKS